MLREAGPVVQALLGTLFTWGVTAAGAGLVFVCSPQRVVLDGSLGFAAGVMLAASYWSLLAPAIDIAEADYGALAFVPVAIGFAIGAAFVHFSELVLPWLGMEDPGLVEVLTELPEDKEEKRLRQLSWKRTLLLALAVTIHNVPEGLAVGVGFGGIGSNEAATFESARNLAVGIGIQNFPEGLAVSLPLHRAGFSKLSAFWYGQLSGMVEPVAGVLGAVAIQWAEPLLPYALAFAAGAMIYVVFDDIIPETCQGNHARVANAGAIVGFLVMMSLDVGLG